MLLVLERQLDSKRPISLLLLPSHPSPSRKKKILWEYRIKKIQTLSLIIPKKKHIMHTRGGERREIGAWTQSYLSVEVVFVLKNSIEVSVHANSVGQHLFLVVQKGVGAEVVGVIHALVHGGAASAVYGGGGTVATAYSVNRVTHPSRQV